MSGHTTFSEIRSLASRVEAALQTEIELIQSFRSKSFDPDEIPTYRFEMAELVTAVGSVSPSAVRAKISELATALTPVANALLAFGQELARPVGLRPFGAARRDEHSHTFFCRIVLWNPIFAGWFDIMRILALDEVPEGELPKGVVPALMGPCPTAGALLTVLLEALRGQSPANMEGDIEDIDLYAVLVGEIEALLTLAHQVSARIGKCTYLAPAYQKELATLRKGSFTNKKFHETVLRDATEAIRLAIDADAALVAGGQNMKEPRKYLNLDDACASYVFLIGYYSSFMVEEGAGQARGAKPPVDVCRQRLAHMLAIPDFSRAYVDAVQLMCVAHPPGDELDAFHVHRGALGAESVAVLFSSLIINYVVSNKDRSPEIEANLEVLLAPKTLDGLLKASDRFREAAAAFSDATERSNVIGASFVTSLLSLSLAAARKHDEKSDGRLDIRFGVAMLTALTGAWHGDWATTLHDYEGDGFAFTSEMCLISWKVLGHFYFLSPAPLAAASPTDCEAALQDALAALEGTACMAGSIFDTLNDHITKGSYRGKRVGPEVLQLAAMAPATVNWAAGAVRTLSVEFASSANIMQINNLAIAQATIRAAHACLAAARAYTAAPWAAWIAATSGDLPYSINFLKALPNLLVSVVGQLSLLLFAIAAGHRTSSSGGLTDELSLAALALDVFTTFEALENATPNVFSPAQAASLNEYAPTTVHTATVAPGPVLGVVKAIHQSLDLDGYLTGPERGVAALMAAVERSGTGNTHPVAESRRQLMSLGAKAAMEDVTASEEAHMKRAKALAMLPCARLGCVRTRRPGEKKQPTKKCSKCFSRFCSTECHKAAWKTHKIGCRALEAEREVAEVGAAAEAVEKKAEDAGRRTGGGGGSGRSPFALRF